MKNNENNRLIVGNGFDLKCGLNTRYIDFFKSNYFERALIFDFIKHANLLLNDNWDTNNYFESLIRYKDINIWSLFFYICSVKICEPIRFGLYLEEHVFDVDDNNNFQKWCSIEEVMRISFLGASNKAKVYNKSIIPLWANINEKFFNNKIKSGIRSEAIMELFISLQNEKVAKITDLYQYLHIKLEEFEKNFGLFIKNEKENCSLFNDNAKKLINEITDSNQKNLFIDSFNFTDLNVEKFIHINGDCSSPIFGIDSKNIAPNSNEYAFTKTFRRLEYNKKTLNKRIFNNFTCLYVYGHSLNEQDYNYFFPILDYLEITKINSNTKIIFVYTIYDEKIRNTITMNLVSGITGLFASYEDYKRTTNQHRLIDILTFQNRLIIKEI